MLARDRVVRIDYTNYRGERSSRLILPHYSWFGESEHHKDGEQWFWHATDLEKGERRDFAAKDIHEWDPTPTVLPWRK